MQQKGRSSWYDSAHIPAKVEVAPTPGRVVIRAKDEINYKWESSETSLIHSFRTEPHLTVGAKTAAIIVKKLWQQRVCVDIIQQNRRQALLTKISF